MRISIENFKSIRSLQNFEIKPFTILSGVNNSGKSSFIQLLLLLKQSIKFENQLFLNGDFYKVKNFRDIIYNKDLKNDLKVSFQFDKNEISKTDGTTDIYNYLDNYNSKISIKFRCEKNIYIKKFNIKLNLPEGKSPFIDIQFNKKTAKYSIESNDNIFGQGIWNENIKNATVNFFSFYPLFFNKNNLIKIEWVKELINLFFENISYIAPNRNPPEDGYSLSEKSDNVGINGEYLAQILEKYAEKPTKFYRIIENKNEIFYKKESKTLIEAVKYYFCDFFEISKDIKAEKLNEIYKITLINKSNLPISIKHVGFGISQLLPIIVEGLNMSNDGTLIIEQPEIHLHPKLQSKLYDFLYSLTLQGKKVIVETHSSHFITRMRRRIAEDINNKMNKNISLTFIEDNIFRTIGLDDFGKMDYYPEDFIEQSSTELRAIMKAQMNKRLKKK